MTWGYVAVAAATVIGGAMQSHSAHQAADAQRHSGDAAIDEQRRQFDQLQQNFAPYLQAGQGGLNGLSALNSGDYHGFENSPDYLYARQQMTQGLDRSAASRGRLYSGGYGVDLAGHLNGLASQNLGNYRSSLQWLANLGQNSAAMQGQAGMGMANAIGGIRQYQGNAAADGAIGAGNSWASAINGLGQAAGSYFGNQSASSYGGGGSQVQQPSNGWGGLPDYYYGANG
jgi:hypothetical protein